ncbi:MAG: LPS-assembly protein LptD [Bacteroidaceae bacterium]|nr:LPS-assembly protein LptD [Bacteroidaceae bacterium]
MSRATLHRRNALARRDSTDVKAIHQAAEAIFDSLDVMTGVQPSPDDYVPTDSIDIPSATEFSDIPELLVSTDTARYIIVHEDTVYLGRAGYTGVDTTAIDSSKQSRNALDAPVHFTASDSVTFDYVESRANLHGSAKVEYTNLEIDAELITMSLDSSTVHAHGVRDSAGKMLTPPVFKQGNDEYEPDAVAYNFKTRKAFVNNVYTQQGEGYLASDESKRDSSGVMYIRHGRYTTCDARHPHFYIALTRGKLRPGKDVVFGPAYLVVEDVPLPLAIPYGFFPFTSSYSSGIIMPTYGDETIRGFYLRDGGYYFAINDKVDLKVLGEIYTKGSWGISGQSTYKKRYRYSGSALFSYQYTQEGEKNMPDFSVQKSFKLQWSHRQDAKANPSQSLSASVNFATSSYERNNLTSMYNPQSYTQSTRTSSVAYTRTFSDIGLTLSATTNMSQNMRDSTISLTLPSLNISLARFNPFKRKKMVGAERWYEKIAMSYTGTLSNSISTKEDKLMHSSLVRDWRNGMRHTIPISASFSLLNYINITPSLNINDRMYAYKVNRSWDTGAQVEVLDTAFGFRNVYDYNMSVSASTKLYGMYRPLIGKKIAAVRHVFTPTVSFSYAPDFGAARYGYYDTYVKTDANGNVSTVTYSPYAGMLYGVPGQGKTGSIAMDISNNIEMKLRSDRDSTGYKKISIIDELGANMSYNMAAKTRPWSDLSTRLRIKLGKNKTYSFNAQWATYAYEIDEDGRVYVGERTEYSYGRFGRFQGMSQNVSYTFNNQTFTKLFGGSGNKNSDKDDDDEDADEDEDERDINESNMDPDLQRAQRGARRSGKEGELDEDGYVKFKFPWSLSFSYGVSVRENTSGRFNKRRMRYPYSVTHTLNFSGNMQIASGWNISWSSGYDFNYKKISMTTASLSRDLHCFSMTCSMVLSPYTSYNFTFAANASTLMDALRWKKQSSYSSNIDWY